MRPRAATRRPASRGREAWWQCGCATIVDARSGPAAQPGRPRASTCSARVDTRRPAPGPPGVERAALRRGAASPGRTAPAPRPGCPVRRRPRRTSSRARRDVARLLELAGADPGEAAALVGIASTCDRTRLRLQHARRRRRPTCGAKRFVNVSTQSRSRRRRRRRVSASGEARTGRRAGRGSDRRRSTPANIDATADRRSAPRSPTAARDASQAQPAAGRACSGCAAGSLPA